MKWCIEDVHDTPCPAPCRACREECDTEPVSTEAARAEFPDLPDAWWVNQAAAMGQELVLA